MNDTYKLTENGVIRSDGASIPNDEGNKEWQKYLEWAKTNTADPIDVIVADPKQVILEELASTDTKFSRFFEEFAETGSLSQYAKDTIARRKELRAELATLRK